MRWRPARSSGDGPLLLTASGRLHPNTRAEIVRVLPPGGRVYVLGGTNAVGTAVEDRLRADGYRVVRLAGATRVETALAVAGEDTPSATVLLGGPAALAPAVEAAVPHPLRVAGQDRVATAAAIATRLWGTPAEGPRTFVAVNGVARSGWAFGLAAAGLSADARAPVLLLTDRVTAPTRQLVSTVASVETMYASPTDLYLTTSRWNPWEPGFAGAVVTTEVHGYDIADPAAIRYVASGSVPGYVLNQFSLSEHRGHLRTATTEVAPWQPDGAGDTSSSLRVMG